MLAFVIASFETTSASLLAFLMNMCRFPEIQEKAYCHIREVLGKGAFTHDLGFYISVFVAEYDAFPQVCLPKVRCSRLLGFFERSADDMPQFKRP